MASVLVIEDDDRIRLSLLLALDEEGFRASGAGTAEEALECQRRRPADVVMVDLMLPNMSGVDCIRELRRCDDVPVLVLSARDATQDVVNALEAGADDYVVKPAPIAELAARLRALRRRVRQPAPEAAAMSFGELTVRPDAGEVLIGGEAVGVTRTEFRLLCELAGHGGRVLSRQELLRHVWGYEIGDERLVDVHVRRLRQKIEPDPRRPRCLVTVRGMGYKLQQ
jgi:DNA-binding response OmpR family regulator